jgi:hypothetical protein
VEYRGVEAEVRGDGANIRRNNAGTRKCKVNKFSQSADLLAPLATHSRLHSKQQFLARSILRAEINKLQ